MRKQVPFDYSITSVLFSQAHKTHSLRRRTLPSFYILHLFLKMLSLSNDLISATAVVQGLTLVHHNLNLAAIPRSHLRQMQLLVAHL